MNNIKRQHRQDKKELKKIGNRARRNFLKQQLQKNPNEAHWDRYEFNDLSTKNMNGVFLDVKRNTKIRDDSRTSN